jgi:hypothetical protein
MSVAGTGDCQLCICREKHTQAHVLCGSIIGREQDGELELLTTYVLYTQSTVLQVLSQGTACSSCSSH